MIYAYICTDCGTETDAFRRVKERDDCPSCDCGGETIRKVTAPQVSPDLKPYWDENISSNPVYIKSKQHRAEVLKANNLAEY